MDIRTELLKLPELDSAAPDRVWQRFQESRRRPASRSWSLPLIGLATVAAAALFVFSPAWMADTPRSVSFSPDSFAGETKWSEVVTLELDGRGTARGTDRDLEISLESGTILAHVQPNTGTQLAVVTDEARVQVVGTVFSVTRGPLGVRTEVTRGKVQVDCADGWSGSVTPEQGAHTCLPIRPALLLTRADALLDAGAADEVLVDTLDRGIALAGPQGVVGGELLVRRMRAHGQAGRVDEALSDARLYLEGSENTRDIEVNRYAGWLAMGARGCGAAIQFLSPLQQAGSPEDRILLAECVAASDPNRAGDLLAESLGQSLDDTWRERARRDLEALGGR